MTVDKRTYTARARREIINKHLYRDHGGQMAIQGESLEDRYARHQAFHEAGEVEHSHSDYEDISDQYSHYLGTKPLRVRLDRPPTKWTLTWHLAHDHGERIVGDALVKMIKHEEMHDDDPEGWSGIEGRVHRHLDFDDPEGSLEYKETSPE